MSAPPPAEESVANAPPALEAGGSRVWQACLACRRKKIKCDGKQPCHNCNSRDLMCEFPGTKDNASTSRYYTASFEARCQQMDSLCRRLEGLTGQLVQSIDVLSRLSLPTSNESPHGDLVQAAHTLRSLPELRNSLSEHHGQPAEFTSHATLQPALQPASRASGTELQETSGHAKDDMENPLSDSEDSGTDENMEACDVTQAQDEAIGTAGALVRDSYGRLRFVGGATNNVLIEAAKSLLPTASMTTPSSTGASHSTQSPEDLEIPFFVRGRVWPELPFIPKPESLPRPPQYVSDLLISLYFDKLHYTFPVLLKPHFMRRYQKMLRASADCSSPKHRKFLMVFFAVCACSAGLMPTSPEGELPGIEYYQKALLMYYASTGEASLERVQCLALLAMCSAGWNTLSQSWNLAGQAVRAALDIGLHLSSRSVFFMEPTIPGRHPDSALRLQVSRRIWWCVYTLDRVTSICLGRPMAVQDDDCDCELPLDMRDEDLVSHHYNHKGESAIDKESSSPMSGFLAFARLCQLSGKIQHFISPSHLRKLATANSSKTQKFLARVDSHDQSLRRWLESLPGNIQFSANNMERGNGGDPALVMCVITFILHAGSLINLYRCFLNCPKQAALKKEVDISGAIAQCVNAAQSCINAAEMVRDLVPSSQYLAICVHYLTLSGIVLLRMPPELSNDGVLEDVKKCAEILKDLEFRWSGAKRSRAIIEQLLLHHRNTAAHVTSVNHGSNDAIPPPKVLRGSKRPFDDFEDTVSSAPENDNLVWGDVPGSEIFHFDPLDPFLFTSWNG